MSIPVITIIRKSGAGKTTLLETLIPELSGEDTLLLLLSITHVLV